MNNQHLPGNCSYPALPARLLALAFLSLLLAIPTLIRPAVARAESLVHETATSGYQEMFYVNPGTTEVDLIIKSTGNAPSEIGFSIDGPDGIKGTAYTLQPNTSALIAEAVAGDLKKWKKTKFANSAKNAIDSFTTGTASGDVCSSIPDVDQLYSYYLSGFFRGLGYPAGYSKSEFCSRWSYSNSAARSTSYSVGVVPDVCGSDKATTAIMVRLNTAKVGGGLFQSGYILKVTANTVVYSGSKAASLKSKSDGKFRGRAIFLFAKDSFNYVQNAKLLMKICKSSGGCTDTLIPVTGLDAITYNGQSMWRAPVPSAFFSTRRGEAKKAAVYLLKGNGSAKIANYGHCLQRKRVRQNVGGYNGPA